MTQDTLPMPLGQLAHAGELDNFRTRSPADILALLKRLQDGNLIVHLHTPDGLSYSTTLWAIDKGRGLISFSADGGSPQLQRLLESDEITVVGYLDSVKLQFDLQGAVLVRGARDCAINAQLPRELFRFQRRDSFRVRPLARSAPTAYLAHPMIPDMQLSLRVLDVSAGGCALFLPETVPPISPGLRINGVTVELDADTRLSCTLMLHHITRLNPDAGGGRLGCEWVGLAGDATRALQLYVDQTQKQRRQLSLP